MGPQADPCSKKTIQVEGETGVMERWPAFACGLTLWFYINYEVFLGEASTISGRLSLDEARKFLARISGKDETEDENSEDATKITRSKAKMCISDGVSPRTVNTK